MHIIVIFSNNFPTSLRHYKVNLWLSSFSEICEMVTINYDILEFYNRIQKLNSHNLVTLKNYQYFIIKDTIKFLNFLENSKQMK